MEAHEHEYGRQVQPGSNTLGVFVFSPEMHPKHTVRWCLLHSSPAAAALPGSYTRHCSSNRVREGKGTANFLGEEDNDHNKDEHPPETARLHH